MKAESPALSFYSCPTAGIKRLRRHRFYTSLKGRVRDMKELVRLEGITKAYGDHVIIPPLSLSIHDGEFLTLLGPSGCGKTTLLRMLAGLDTPTKGKIILDGQDITNLPPYKRDVNMVFQNYALFPHMTAEENIGFGLRMKGVGKEEAAKRTQKLLKLIRLEDLRSRYPSQMSGGQQQRVALARAIVIRPQVLLMDEPLSNLDAKLRIEMRNAIKQIQRRVDITTVYVTHDQEEALAVSDRIAVMNGGVICQIGRPADIYKRPKNVFVSTFIGLSNLLDGHIVKKGDKTSISFKENEDWLVDMDNLSGGVEDGEEVIISVRPEEFDMEPGTKEGIRGVIRSSVFLGLTTHYFITTGSGQELEILQTQEGHDILPDGSAVTLTVKAGRINVFRRATEETLIREEGL